MYEHIELLFNDKTRTIEHFLKTISYLFPSFCVSSSKLVLLSLKKYNKKVLI